MAFLRKVSVEVLKFNKGFSGQVAFYHENVGNGNLAFCFQHLISCMRYPSL